MMRGWEFLTCLGILRRGACEEGGGVVWIPQLKFNI